MHSFLPKASNTIPLKNLNYLQAKEGGAETRKLPPISQLGGFRRSVQGEQSNLIWSDFCTCLINNYYYKFTWYMSNAKSSVREMKSGLCNKKRVQKSMGRILMHHLHVKFFFFSCTAVISYLFVSYL